MQEKAEGETMTSQEAIRDFLRKTTHLQHVREMLVMMCPVDYIIDKGKLLPHPKPSPEAKAAIQYIDETLREIAREYEGWIHDDE